MYESNDEIGRGCMLMFLSMFSFILFLYFVYTTYAYCGFSPKSNPTVEGVIVKSAIEKSIFDNRRGYDINIIYEYHVDGRKYLSDMISCGESSNESPEEKVEKYPVGKKVTVYHRANNPSLSVIEPQLGRSGSVMAYMFGALFIVSLAGSFISSQNSGWQTIGLSGIFILLSSIFTIAYPPTNKDAALNNDIFSIIFHSIIILSGLACLIFSYILKKKNA